MKQGLQWLMVRALVQDYDQIQKISIMLLSNISNGVGGLTLTFLHQKNLRLESFLKKKHLTGTMTKNIQTIQWIKLIGRKKLYSEENVAAGASDKVGQA